MTALQLHRPHGAVHGAHPAGHYISPRRVPPSPAERSPSLPPRPSHPGCRAPTTSAARHRLPPIPPARPTGAPRSTYRRRASLHLPPARPFHLPPARPTPPPADEAPSPPAGAPPPPPAPRGPSPPAGEASPPPAGAPFSTSRRRGGRPPLPPSRLPLLDDGRASTGRRRKPALAGALVPAPPPSAELSTAAPASPHRCESGEAAAGRGWMAAHEMSWPEVRGCRRPPSSQHRWALLARHCPSTAALGEPMGLRPPAPSLFSLSLLWPSGPATRPKTAWFLSLPTATCGLAARDGEEARKLRLSGLPSPARLPQNRRRCSTSVHCYCSAPAARGIWPWCFSPLLVHRFRP